MAVMALMQDLYDAAAEVNDVLVKAEGEPDERIRSAITMLFDSVDSSPHTYRALLEARAASPTVRQMWDAGRADFAGVIAGMITDERAAGRADDGPAADALASVLLDLNDHALERHSLGSGPPRDEHIEALTFIWLRTHLWSRNQEEAAMSPDNLTFSSQGTPCAAWHYRAAHDELATAAGRPAVVMAHGLAGTKDSGLAPFAEAFAAAGLDVILFDYRGFGASEGSPRQTVSLAGQIDDYRAALTAASKPRGCRPEPTGAVGSVVGRRSRAVGGGRPHRHRRRRRR